MTALGGESADAGVQGLPGTGVLRSRGVKIFRSSGSGRDPVIAGGGSCLPGSRISSDLLQNVAIGPSPSGPPGGARSWAAGQIMMMIRPPSPTIPSRDRASPRLGA